MLKNDNNKAKNSNHVYEKIVILSGLIYSLYFLNYKQVLIKKNKCIHLGCIYLILKHLSYYEYFYTNNKYYTCNCFRKLPFNDLRLL